MTLTELLNRLVERGAVRPSRVKDLKTSIRYLTRAVQAENPRTILDAEELEGRYRTAVRAYFSSLDPTPSVHTIRNTVDNLHFLYDQAHDHHLIRAFTPCLPRMTHAQAMREAGLTSPYRQRFSPRLRTVYYYCRPTDWPQAFRQPWDQYCQRRRFEVRPSTLERNQVILSLYLGYGLHIEQPPITTWEALFDPERLLRFITWHAERVGVSRITTTGQKVATIIRGLAKHEHRPELAALDTLVRKLPRPEPMHNKQHPDHNIRPEQLEVVGLTLRSEAQQPLGHNLRGNDHPGSLRAIRCQIGLILRLLIRVPMRQRNIREMCLGRNLYQDAQGIWQLRFQGDELKIRERGGRINTFPPTFPPDLVEHLEEFLQQHRLHLPNAKISQHVFLTRTGRPYSTHSLWQTIRQTVMVRLGKRFYPHLIRTIYADTYLLRTHDVDTVAFMLNDTPQTMYKHYHELRAHDHVRKAYQYTQELLGSPPAAR